MGWVYVLKNPVMPGLLKIGMTTRRDLDSRVAEISGATGVPEPFHIVFSHKTRNPKDLEWRVHRRLHRWRINIRREFFFCPLWVAKRAIRLEAGVFSPVDWVFAVSVVLLIAWNAFRGFNQ